MTYDADHLRQFAEDRSEVDFTAGVQRVLNRENQPSPDISRTQANLGKLPGRKPLILPRWADSPPSVGFEFFYSGILPIFIPCS